MRTGRFWHGSINAHRARHQWHQDDQAYIQAELARADRAYAKRRLIIKAIADLDRTEGAP